MRPLDQVEGACYVPTLHQDFEGERKRVLFNAIKNALMTHIESVHLNQIDHPLSAHFASFIEIVKGLHNAVSLALPHIGTLGEKRVVIGNDNRPKMTPEEESGMLSIYEALKDVIHEIHHLKDYRPH